MHLVVLFLFGLIVGSFLNVVIYRLPRNESFVARRSRCAHCGKDIAWYDLFPVFSFVVLRRRCRYCKFPISFQYPIVEILSSILFVFLWQQPLMLAVFEMLLVLAVIDLKHFVIPDSLLIVLGVVAVYMNHSPSFFITAFACVGIFFLLWFLSKGRWMGFGDVKLAAVLGLLFGFPGTFVIIYIAVIAGGLLGALLLLFKKATMKTELPFGTILIFGAAVFYVLQPQIYEILSRF